LQNIKVPPAVESQPIKAAGKNKSPHHPKKLLGAPYQRSISEAIAFEGSIGTQI